MPASLNYRTYNGFHRGIGDVSNTPVLELLVAGELTETYSRALHIAQADDANTDWNVAANAHPTLYLHSTTTPATDYIRFDHDGTTADIDAVGADTLSLQVAGTEYLGVTTTAIGIPDDVSLELGTTDDSVIRHRTATLAANTALTDVLIGTPVSAALAANSTMISNVTANGDIAAYVNTGTNSAQFLFADASASALAFGQTGWTANFLEGMTKVTLGTESAFGTTQPTNALVMRAGTAPAGAITTAGALFASTTAVRKIIADGTVSNVETAIIAGLGGAVGVALALFGLVAANGIV